MWGSRARQPGPALPRPGSPRAGSPSASGGAYPSTHGAQEPGHLRAHRLLLTTRVARLARTARPSTGWDPRRLAGAGGPRRAVRAPECSRSVRVTPTRARVVRLCEGARIARFRETHGIAQRLSVVLVIAMVQMAHGRAWRTVRAALSRSVVLGLRIGLLIRDAYVCPEGRRTLIDAEE